MIARVTLDIALKKDLDYLVPEELRDRVEVGSRVKVPFGSRSVLGVVTALVTDSPVTGLRPIERVLSRRSLVTPKVLALARWIADYYCCPVEVALRSVVPEAVRREKTGWRERLFVRANPAVAEMPPLTARQRELWHVIEEFRELPLRELLRLTGATEGVVRRLEEKGLVTTAPQVLERDPYGEEVIVPTQPLELNPEQREAFEAITQALVKAQPDQAGTGEVFLLHGVTGSGKTEVYLQAIARALEMGRGAIVLVPEISLTPQTIERFKARFATGPVRTMVAVLHSHLSAGERHDEWHKIRDGRARIVIGARSAVFAPVDPLGLIIVDEEHEHSYKQEEAPRYHARDVAVVRARREGAVAVLGSATPSLESYYNAQRGKYRLLELTRRIDDRKLPLVRVVDMRHEKRRGGGPPVFSRMLREAILRRLERREQTILFLNRRGFSTSLQCPRCGYVAGCPHCSVAMTYHRQSQRLLCHICGYQATVPTRCPQPDCQNPAIRYAGVGTQRVEEALRQSFPLARVQRMDSDILQRKGDYRRILAEFRAGRIDILLGTQMIAKGLHFPNVTLVGVIYADLSLHRPDFRAAERTFQLLAQVSGRAGRGDAEGEVIIQAFTPFHPAIQYARRHDYVSFYEQEIEFRRELNYPPVSRIALLTLKGRNEDKVRFVAEHLRKRLEKELADWPQLVLAGPAPAPLLKAETFYRYQIMVRTRRMLPLSRLLARIDPKELPEGLQLVIDIDPVDLA